MSNLASTIDINQPGIQQALSLLDISEESKNSSASEIPLESHFRAIEKQPIWYKVVDHAIGRHMVHSTMEALRDFARMEEVSLHHARYEGGLCHEFQSRITLEGIPEWFLIVDIEQSLIEEIVNKLLGITETDVEVLQDLTNEMANLIAGGFKTYLPCFTKLGLPTPLSSEFDIQSHAATFPLWKIASYTPHGMLHVYTSPVMLKHD